MEHSPSWVANSHSANQEIPRLLWNPEAYYCVHKNLPLVPVLSHMYPVHIFPRCIFKIRSNLIILSTPINQLVRKCYIYFHKCFRYCIDSSYFYSFCSNFVTFMLRHSVSWSSSDGTILHCLHSSNSHKKLYSEKSGGVSEIDHMNR